jgi:uncharacterized protein (DUF1684 family)
MKWTTLTLPLALAAWSACAPGMAQGASASPGSAGRDSVTAAILKDRADTERWLKSSPTSYLAAVRRMDFEDHRTLTVGRERGNDLRLEDSSLAGHHLQVTVVGDSFRVEGVDPGADFTVDGVRTRATTLPPRTIGVGRFMLRLSHQRFPALILFDPASPRFQEFKGLRYFPVDLSYRFVLPLTPNPRPDTVIILSTRGNRRRALRAGWFDFKVKGRACRLEVTRLLEPGVGENDLAIFFRDLTSGSETYGVGRYVNVQPLEDGRYVIDFNQAYNPACAISEYYNCPIPPKNNTLRVAIRAGELDSHYQEH